MKSFDSGIGEFSFKSIGQIFGGISDEKEIVGLSITEHLPWNATNLRQSAQFFMFDSKDKRLQQ
ncbi:hypothetical protein IW492_11600 [Enterococcus sp. BWB1-3]|uniref:hypothetical protein n=1 Tax=unclassified Enterococcus TaxID=2608891 RepID=UPI0019244AEF|nr:MULTISPECIES: hypothetical protein [unclassified Enterococcus]MBL1229876.1 hypothetical protein [Enterococcus sp. BWB1-3]MCB5951392.1 hypothetical protein [Enterococcus sp. BWT-B8]